jgi:hypothetical protein
MKKDNVALRRASARRPCGFDNVRDQTAAGGVNSKGMRLIGNGESQPKTETTESCPRKGAKRLTRFQGRHPACGRCARGA